MSEPRESIVSILVSWRIERELARGAADERARLIAETEIRQLLGRVGGKQWYLPLAITQTQQALAIRDDAIRLAVSGGATYPVIKRSFRVSRGHFYRIVHGKRNGHHKKVA